MAIVKYFLLLVLLAAPVFAEDIYVAQTAAGADNGTSCANAKSINWFTNYTSWTAGGGIVGAGDTVHVCGLVSNTVICWNGGSAGSPLTISGEPGQKWIAPTFPFTFVIYIGSASYITLSNVWIECTSNGLGLGFTNLFNAVIADGGSHLVVDRCVITNTYVRTPGGSETNTGATSPTGIRFQNGSDWIVRHSVLYQVGEAGIAFGRLNAAVYTNWLADSNIVYGANHGIQGYDNTDSKVFGVYIRGNRIDGSYVWDGTGGVPEFYHHNGIYFWADNNGSAMGRMDISGNNIGPKMGTGPQTTSEIFVSALGFGAYGSNIVIYNNQLNSTNGYQCNNAHSLIWGVFKEVKYYNNSIYAASTGDGIRLICGAGSDIAVYNNIMSTPSALMIYNDGGAGLTLCDSNIYFGTTQFRYGAGGFESLATWQARGYDMNSTFLDPKYILPGANLRLQSTSSAIGAGMNFNSVFTVDHDGITRGSSWDAGAFEFVPADVTRVVNVGTARVGTLVVP